MARKGTTLPLPLPSITLLTNPKSLTAAVFHIFITQRQFTYQWDAETKEKQKGGSENSIFLGYTEVDMENSSFVCSDYCIQQTIGKPMQRGGWRKVAWAYTHAHKIR